VHACCAKTAACYCLGTPCYSFKSNCIVTHINCYLQAEEAERRTLIANRDVNDASQDLTKLRRTSLSVQSAPRSLDLHAVVGAAAQKAVSVVGQEALVEVGSFHYYAQTSCSCTACSACLNNAMLSRLQRCHQAWNVSERHVCQLHCVGISNS